jgi:high-affinity nickel permease
MNESMFATLSLGFVLGLKHATEADHLAAVSTIVSEKRSIWQSASVGMLWGVGHTTSLLVAGVLVIALGVAIPERIATLLELLVALMIMFLGARLLRAHVHSHTHDGRPHIHLHFHDKQHAHVSRTTHSESHATLSSYRPVLIGIVHGLAGSAALTLLVLSEVVRHGNAWIGFAYLLVFGIGSIGGMLALSCVIGLPFSLGHRFFQGTLLPLRIVIGSVSIGFGFFYACQIVVKLYAL